MLRILHVYPQLNCGGTEMVFYNLIKFSDIRHFRYDILVQKSGERDPMFKLLGCNIITMPYHSKQQYRQDLEHLFRQNNYQAVHTHMHNTMEIVLEEAKKAGVPHCISHSHSARIDLPQFLWFIRFIRNHKYEKYATDLFGCSKLALKWLFPRKWKKGKVIYNGIDTNKFIFNKEDRYEYRKKNHISNTTKVILNIGRCTRQKNQHFILDRAKDLQNEDILFLIIGAGPLFKDLEKRLENENIANVRLLGQRCDIVKWLSAADVFIFPSLYEGLGIVAIEAQTNGLPVISTDTIPQETDMQLGIFHRVPLRKKKVWNTWLKNSNISQVSRATISSKAYQSHYNINNVVKYVENIYKS